MPELTSVAFIAMGSPLRIEMMKTTQPRLRSCTRLTKSMLTVKAATARPMISHPGRSLLAGSSAARKKHNLVPRASRPRIAGKMPATRSSHPAPAAIRKTMFRPQRSSPAGRNEVSTRPQSIPARSSARIATATIGYGSARLSGTKQAESSSVRTKGNSANFLKVYRVSQLSVDLSKQSPLFSSMIDRKYWSVNKGS